MKALLWCTEARTAMLLQSTLALLWSIETET
jgi:hypothetical protein